MAHYSINPGRQISGTVEISGSKNAALPILAACLLCEGTFTLHSIPNLVDTRNMLNLLKHFGVKYNTFTPNSISIDSGICTIKSAPHEIVNLLRASFLIIGPLLARFGKIRIPLPGGCRIGARPIDLHLKGFAAMGAKIKQGHGYVDLKCDKLVGSKIYLDFPSVGATENIMLAASLADGKTIIENAATEPEIENLADFLCKMGADVKGAGSDTIFITGKKKLHSAEYTIIPDRIEAGTFMAIAAVSRSCLTLNNVIPEHLKPVTAKLCEMGISVTENQNSIRITPCDRLHSVDIKTLPYPGFPTDMQAQFMPLMSIADGTGVVVETIFENRFMQVPELMRMGAKIRIDGRTAVIDGTKRLSGAKVRATDLRAGASLVIAALAAQGGSDIYNIEHIERGYENFVGKLSEIGVDIKREND